MTKWRIVKRTRTDKTEEFSVQGHSGDGKWVAGFGVTETIEEAKKCIVEWKKRLGEKDEVVCQE